MTRASEFHVMHGFVSDGNVGASLLLLVALGDLHDLLMEVDAVSVALVAAGR